MGRLGVGLRDKGFDEKNVGHLEANKGTSVQSVRREPMSEPGGGLKARGERKPMILRLQVKG